MLRCCSPLSRSGRPTSTSHADTFLRSVRVCGLPRTYLQLHLVRASCVWCVWLVMSVRFMTQYYYLSGSLSPMAVWDGVLTCEEAHALVRTARQQAVFLALLGQIGPRDASVVRVFIFFLAPGREMLFRHCILLRLLRHSCLHTRLSSSS
jgi:hypothetical protein